jgi:hypothetical protein
LDSSSQITIAAVVGNRPWHHIAVMASSKALRKAKSKFKRKEKRNRKKETPIQRKQRCSVRNEKDRARGPRKPLTAERKQARCDYEAARHKQRKESKKPAAVPFSAVPGFELTKCQRDICRCIRTNLRRGGAKRNFRLKPHMGWFRAFIEGGGEHAVPRETQEQQKARLSKQRGRSAQNRAVRTSQQR